MSKQYSIFSLASGNGRSGIAVLRISGPKSLYIFKKISKNKKITPRYATKLDFYDPTTGALVDSGISIFFKAPNSFTGEDVLELYLHGSSAVLSRFYKILSHFQGVRPAQPGEFSKIAFLNGKLDLTQAEGLNDLILSETDHQREQALNQLNGSLREFYGKLRAIMIANLSRIEALIDFSDEDLPRNIKKNIQKDTNRIIKMIRGALKDGNRGQTIRSGYRIAILGPANSGKSSLLNTIAMEEKSIVSSVPGTTRDIIEVQLNIAGYPVILMDTAGFRNTKNPIEIEGLNRSKRAMESSNLRLILYDATCFKKSLDINKGILRKNDFKLLTKSDIRNRKIKGFLTISSKNGNGINILMRKLEKRVARDLEFSDSPFITRERHRIEMEKALYYVESFKKKLQNELDLSLLAEDMRLASRSIGAITGVVNVEEVLGNIFSTFCIGK